MTNKITAKTTEEILSFINKTENKTKDTAKDVLQSSKERSTRKLKRTSLILDQEIAKGLGYLAMDKGKNQSKIIEELLRDYLIKHKYDKKHDMELS